MRNAAFASLLFLFLAGTARAQGMDHAAHTAEMARAQRQAEVSRRGKDVMPFSLPATRHIFTRSRQGGIQQVVARKATDAAQVKLVRQHLREIREQFLEGDFSGPAHIHGQDMPGLAELEAAPPDRIAIAYKDIRGGAQLTYSTSDPNLVAALHKWFDAQLADHGKDAMAGHGHHPRPGK
ncbi:MAG TPA: aspartate carbamoyltransferase [Ramlibacter sp.]